jgi:hypothetical protein
VSGIEARDSLTGKLHWRSLGFAPRACSNAIPASGRIFYNPQVSGLLFAFEPAGR